MYGVHGWPQQTAMTRLVSEQTLACCPQSMSYPHVVASLCRLQLVLGLHRHACPGLLGFLQYHWASEGVMAEGAKAVIQFGGKEMFCIYF